MNAATSTTIRPPAEFAGDRPRRSSACCRGCRRRTSAAEASHSVPVSAVVVDLRWCGDPTSSAPGSRNRYASSISASTGIPAGVCGAVSATTARRATSPPAPRRGTSSGRGRRARSARQPASCAIGSASLSAGLPSVTITRAPRIAQNLATAMPVCARPTTTTVCRRDPASPSSELQGAERDQGEQRGDQPEPDDDLGSSQPLSS